MSSIYLRKGKWYFAPVSRAVNGLWISSLPLVVLDCSASDEEKGRTALDSLSESMDPVPNPADPELVIAPLLEMANVKSWTTFMNGTKYLSLEIVDGQLVIYPHEQMKRPKGARKSISQMVIRLPGDSPAFDVGVALEQAFDRCR